MKNLNTLIRFTLSIVISVALFNPNLSFAAKDSAARSLDDKVQSLKKEVMKLNRNLFILEEELLFPGGTQIAIFLASDVGNFFHLDSVQIKIDDKIVTNYLYTKQETEALSRGGIQRLYTGNVTKGKHELVAIFRGPGPNGRLYKRAQTYVFEKGSSTKYLKLKITDKSRKLQPEFVISEWD